MNACRIENHVIQLANNHSRCEINNEPEAALLSQVSGHYDPEDEQLVPNNKKNAERDIYNRLIEYLWELLVYQKALSKTLIVLGKHVVGNCDQHVSQGQEQVRFCWVDRVLRCLYPHDEERELLSQ